MDFIKLLIRFIPQFKGRIIAYISLNFLCSTCSVFSFIAIIPLIQILFKLSDKNFTYLETSNIESFSDFLDIIKNNIMFSLQEKISVYGEFKVLLMIGGFVILMSFLFNFISYFAYWVRIPIRTGISRDLRKDAYNKITSMPIKAFTKENRGDFVSRMTNDVEEVEYGIGTTLDMFIKDPIQIIVYIITMIGISSQLTLYAIIMITVVCVFVLLLGQVMQRISFDAQIKRGQILSAFEQTLGILPIVKSFNAQKMFQKKFDILNIKTQKVFNKQNRFYSLAWPSTDFLITVIIVLMLCLGGNLILSGKSDINPAVFIGFLGVLYSIISPIRDMMKCTFGIRKAMASVVRLNKILAINDEIINEKKDSISESKEIPIIAIKDLSFKYDNESVLENISLQINKGQKVAILGATGSGKSTLLSLLIRLYDDYEGTIQIGGKDIRSYSYNAIRNYMAYVPQNPLLLNDSIKNNITLCNDKFSEEDIIKAAKQAEIHDFITLLPDNYNTIIGDRGCNLSGGQQQCISLARAFIKDSPILLIDEGTAALDPELESYVMSNIINDMNKKTMIIVSHKISTVLNADYIYVFNDGKIIESGTPKELCQCNGYFSSMAKLQNIKI